MSFQHPEYEAPPVIEAVIELVFADRLNEEDLRRAADALTKKDYPSRQKEAGFELQLDASGPRMEKTGDRWSLRDSAAQETVIIQQTSVIFSRQSPYPGWPAFFEAAWKVFSRVRAKLGYKRMARVGVRYVNRLDIPRDQSGRTADLSEYLHVGPRHPRSENLEQPGAFLTQSDFFNVLGASLVTVRAATTEPAIIDHTSVLLDLDVQTTDVPQSEVDLQELIHGLREIKNTVFLACITSKAEALFRPIA